jgi:hypothetical protein
MTGDPYLNYWFYLAVVTDATSACLSSLDPYISQAYFTIYECDPIRYIRAEIVNSLQSHLRLLHRGYY